MMDENNIERLWNVCVIIKDFCEQHKNCDYCPFYDSRNSYNECTFANVTDFDVDELQKLFPVSELKKFLHESELKKLFPESNVEGD